MPRLRRRCEHGRAKVFVFFDNFPATASNRRLKIIHDGGQKLKELESDSSAKQGKGTGSRSLCTACGAANQRGSSWFFSFDYL